MKKTCLSFRRQLNIQEMWKTGRQMPESGRETTEMSQHVVVNYLWLNIDLCVSISELQSNFGF